MSINMIADVMIKRIWATKSIGVPRGTPNVTSAKLRPISG
jgi:hypothetical protein